MDIQRELQLLVESGLKFSIEVNGLAVLLWVGDYVRQSTAAATVATLEQAVEWLRQYGGPVAPHQPTARASLSSNAYLSSAPEAL